MGVRQNSMLDRSKHGQRPRRSAERASNCKTALSATVQGRLQCGAVLAAETKVSALQRPASMTAMLSMCWHEKDIMLHSDKNYGDGIAQPPSEFHVQTAPRPAFPTRPQDHRPAQAGDLQR